MKAMKVLSSVAALVCATVLFLLPMPKMDVWLYNNDTLSSMRLALPNVLADNGFMTRFATAAVENCHANMKDAKEAGFCAKYQQNLSINAHYNYPLAIPFALGLTNGYPSGNLAEKTLTAVQLFTLSGILLALLAYVLIFTGRVFPAQSLAVHAVVAGSSFLAFFSTLWLEQLVPDFLIEVSGRQPLWYGLLYIAIVGALVAGGLRFCSGSWERLRECYQFSVVAFSMLFLGVSALLRIIGWFPAVTVIISLAVFSVCMFIAMREFKIGTVIALIVVFLLSAFYDARHFHLTVFYSREQLILVFVAIMAAAASRPNSKVIWLLPLCFLFHVSLASLIAVCLFAAEATACLILRRTSRLLAVSAVMSGIGVTFNFVASAKGGITDMRSVDYAAVVSDFLASGIFLPMLVWGLLSFGCSVYLLVRGTERWLPLARFGFLYAGLCVITAVAAAVRAGGADNYYKGALYVLYYMDGYIGPVICIGGIVVLLVCLVPQKIGPTDRTSLAGHIRGHLGVVALITASLALAVIKVPALSTYRSDWPRLAWLGTKMAVGVTEPKMWREGLEPANGDDDVYYLRASNPKNDPIMYFSLLKATIRADKRLLDMEKVRIEAIP